VYFKNDVCFVLDQYAKLIFIVPAHGDNGT